MPGLIMLESTSAYQAKLAVGTQENRVMSKGQAMLAFGLAGAVAICTFQVLEAQPQQPTYLRLQTPITSRPATLRAQPHFRQQALTPLRGWMDDDEYPEAPPPIKIGDPVEEEVAATTMSDLKKKKKKGKKFVADTTQPVKSKQDLIPKDPNNPVMAQWKAGKLVPEGWEYMSLDQRLRELWVGKYGALFWSNTIAIGFVFVLVAGWVIFRFLLPALGFYTLQKGFAPDPEELLAMQARRAQTEEFAGPTFDIPRDAPPPQNLMRPPQPRMLSPGALINGVEE